MVVFLTSKELAKRWKMSEGTLRNWRATSQGPKFVIIGVRNVLYPLESIEKYEIFNQPVRKQNG